jgi:16S rRNA (cytosine967-C5)-methyltransferase
LTRRPNARGYAAELLHDVAYRGRSLDRVLSDASPLDRDRPLVHELTIGCVRHFYSLSDEINGRLSAPLKPRDAIVLCLLIVGCYQLRHTRIPGYAAVNETVNATRQIGRPWARGLINQVLRRIASEPAPEPRSEEAALDHPQWLIELIRSDYPDAWREILAASLTRAPLSLRINSGVTNRASYVDALVKRGVSAHFGAPGDCVVLDTPVPAADLPGLESGAVSVQDSGAMWAAPLLGAAKGERVLDACAAPGGKAMHLLERSPGIELLALDIDAERCELVRSECRRLGADPALVVTGDGTCLEWWDGVPFERVLLDVPCSGTGTLRRHPDIKLLKRETDIGQYQDIQGRLLENLWRVVAVGGRLLYCTCSVLSLENDCVIDRFLAQTPDASVTPIVADWGMPTRLGRQLLPEVNGGDGFYYAMLEKRPAQ